MIFYDIRSGHHLDQEKKHSDIEDFKKRFDQVTYQDKKIEYVKFVILCDVTKISNEAKQYNFNYADLMTLNLDSFIYPSDKRDLYLMFQKLNADRL